MVLLTGSFSLSETIQIYSFNADLGGVEREGLEKLFGLLPGLSSLYYKVEMLARQLGEVFGFARAEIGSC